MGVRRCWPSSAPFGAVDGITLNQKEATMLPLIVEKMPSPTRQRLHDAFDNPKRAIGFGEPDHDAVGLVQVLLQTVGIPLPISVKVHPDLSLSADGKFGDETKTAVTKFQTREGLKPDGLVGHDTLSALNAGIPRVHPVTPALGGPASQTIRTKPFRCSPAALICPDR
jgi:peptidoglycan hydrolase-like protein with peptidoglycan-binding domain